MFNRVDSFVVIPGAAVNTVLLSLGFWEGLTAVSVAIGTIVLVVYRVRVAQIDLKLKQAEAAARGIEL